MREDIAIVGIGETAALRRSDRPVRALILEAVRAAIEDAGLSPHEVDGIVTESLITPTTVPHDWVAAMLGIESHFGASSSGVGAGIVAAPMLARMAINAGLATTVVSYFGVDWGTRAGGPYAFHDLHPMKARFEKPYGFDAQPSYFAVMAQRYMHEYGLREEQLGAIAVRQRANSIRTGRGQNMKPMVLTDYLAAAMVSEPLRYPDCCLISDGAIAFVMTTGDRARHCAKPPVYVRGVGFGSESISGEDVFTQKPDFLRLPGVGTARRAVEKDAGMTLAEANFAELYDCFTISCLLQTEDLGLCKKGEGGDFATETALPINTHGGLLSYSYRLGGEHITEAVRQLRGEAGAVQVPGAELGFVTGLTMPDYAILLLGR